MRGLAVLIALWGATLALHLDWLGRCQGSGYLWGDAWVHIARVDAFWQCMDQGNWEWIRRDVLRPTQYPPLSTFVAACVLRVTGPAYVPVLAVTQAAFLAMALGAWELAGRGWGGVLAGALVLLSPFAFLDGKRFMLDAPMAACLTLALGCWRRGGGWLVPGFLLGAAAGLCRYQAVLYLAALLVSLPFWPDARHPGAARRAEPDRCSPPARRGRREPLGWRMRAAASILAALAVCAWWAGRSLEEVLPLVAMSRLEDVGWQEMLARYLWVLWSSLLGPPLAVAALWGAVQRGQRWGVVYLGAVLVALGGFSVAKARFLAPVLPLLAVMAAAGLRGRPWATAVLLVAMALPWWPLAPVEVADSVRLESYIHTNNSGGSPDAGPVRPPVITDQCGSFEPGWARGAQEFPLYP